LLHIDYNDGFVLPAAIDKIIFFTNSTTSKIIAIDLDDSFEVDLTTEMELTDNVSNYIRGVINQLKIKGFEFDGFNCVFSSNIPVGSGLSSSAALECGFYLE
jgi:galactokinase